ncbi:MAG: hypothetical protein L6R36_003579 [Xanthoria steineri]|nr:MAG: hypothetical protein L6R36_003579 [Xanthoria steineri]
MESPWARIVNETGQANERSEHVRASGGGGEYGGRGDRRRRRQTFPHEAEAWDRYNREVADYNHELDGFHREVDEYHREMDQLSHNLDRFATLQQQQPQGCRGRPQPSETTGSEKDPDEAAEVESRQQQARAERRFQAEMMAEQKRMEQMAAMGGMHGMGGGRDPRMGRGGWY